MGRITTGVGLVSGINSKDIIDQLMALEARPKDVLQTRIDGITQQKLAYTDLQTRLTGLKLNGTTLKKQSTFQNAATTSSDESVLTATASPGAAVGSYQFQVARLVTTQQGISRGFADFDSAKLGAGTITIEAGGGELSQQNLLSELRGGEGMRRGLFKITDRSGATAVIDTTAAVSLDDVIKKINTTLDISVRASVDGDKLVLTDTTGKTTGNLIVQDVGEGHAAEDLGLVGNVAANSIDGTDINFLGRSTSLTQLNDGRGMRVAAKDDDFALNLADGSTVNVSVRTAKTLGDVIDAINTAGGGKVKAEVVPGSNGIRLTDTSGGGGAFSVTALNDSHAAADLGFETTAAGTTIDGGPLLAGLGTVLISSLNGGQGLTLGSINIKSRAAGAGVDIDLSGSTSVADVLKKINDANAGVKASLNAAGNGIQIVDTSGGAGDLVIDEASGGTTAADLGIVGTFDVDAPLVNGKNLQRAWVSENTLLADYNGGKGVSPGKFQVTNSAGKTAIIDLTQGNEIRLEDVINEINSRDIGVTASINAHGDGLLLTDTSGGSGKMKIDEISGTTAADLNIKGTAGTDGTINGSMEKTITVTATDTLQSIQTKINDLNWGVTAQIINDGSANAPFRLSINAKNAGRDGRVVFDAGATTLGTRTLVDAQDAAVFVGGADAAQPLLITASKNQLAGVIKGVNVDLHGVSDKPVTLNVSRNFDNVSSEIQKFTDSFNEMIDKITDLTKFDTDTNTRGLLLGETTVQTVQTEMYAALQTVVPAGGKFRTLGDIGLSVGDGAKLVFDQDKFNAVLADNPDAVMRLFTSADQTINVSTPLSSLNEGRGVGITGGQPDMRAVLLDGSSIDIDLTDANTVGDVIDKINQVSGTKLKASLTADGALKLTDSTRARNNGAQFVLSSFPGSSVKADLRLGSDAQGNSITGAKLVINPNTKPQIGIGTMIEQRISVLIDPVNGAIPRENKTLDERTQQFTDRMSQIDGLLQQKRTRLENQFANLESVLANLQSQQSALGGLSSIRPVQASTSSK